MAPGEGWVRSPRVDDLCSHITTGMLVLVNAVNGRDVIVTGASDDCPISGPIPYSLFLFQRLFRLA